MPNSDFFADQLGSVLPEGWEIVHSDQTKEGEVYFYNEKTCQTTWVKPGNNKKIDSTPVGDKEIRESVLNYNYFEMFLF